MIPDDNSKHVQRVIVEYGGDPRQCVVLVRPMPENGSHIEAQCLADWARAKA